ncbi:Helitron helicase [Phytophthora megakarya]|uniref:ATP-dependent DNA helicase n=1 Tax=Phytophthora megakarya TaxID=4795 RepID=A0A225W364_9STRA|nr:Helitron helicase [Phytophthora megakarya]
MQSSWQSQKTEQIRNASLIIWDAVPLMDRGFFKAVARVVRDIMKNESEPSGGKVIVFSGCHRQILPVLKDATRAETIAACFKSSNLAADLAKFSEFLLQIGEGRYPVNEDINEVDICLLHDMCVFPEPLEVPPVLGEPRDENLMVHDVAPDSDNVAPEAEDADDDRRTRNVNALIDAVYPQINADELLNEYDVGRTILAPTNANVGRINEMVAARITSETKEYLSTDRRSRRQEPTPIIMIRNLNSDAGLCNGTRLRVISLRERSIEATVMSGPAKRNTVLFLASYSTQKTTIRRFL